MNPQAPLVQVGARPFAGSGQGEQDPPQLFGLVLEEQTPLQSWYPVLHVNPQLVPLHVGVPLVGAVHGVHDVPHVAVLLFDRQAPLQS